VGPGTGLAPLHGFLEELEKRKEVHGSIGKVYLFFGCQTDAEFLYENELKVWKSKNIITGLHVAFSRQGQRQYVQHTMVPVADALWTNVLNAQGSVYICGDAKRMAPDVKKALTQVVAQSGHLNSEDASNFISQMCIPGSTQRYHADVWASSA